MKKLFLVATAFVMGFAAMAQQKAEDLMKFDIDRYDFGQIKQGVPVSTYFTVTNITDKPIVIENAWAGCGCTTPEYSKEPIAPHGTARIKVGYNAGAMGHFEKDVNVKLAGVDATKIIKITGEVVAADAYDAITKTKAEVAPVKSEKEAAKASKATSKAAKKTAKKTSASK